MSARTLEAFMARLYTEARLRRSFLAAPLRTARKHGLTGREGAALAAIDRDDLELAGAMYTSTSKEHAAARAAPSHRTAGRRSK